MKLHNFLHFYFFLIVIISFNIVMCSDEQSSSLPYSNTPPHDQLNQRIIQVFSPTATPVNTPVSSENATPINSPPKFNSSDDTKKNYSSPYKSTPLLLRPSMPHFELGKAQELEEEEKKEEKSCDLTLSIVGYSIISTKGVEYMQVRDTEEAKTSPHSLLERAKKLLCLLGNNQCIIKPILERSKS